ncbi:MAG: Zn-dependent exopeptidase M28, partial [Erysipelotrichaceae bacterium]|nr:Zn-dependent exopeptidase M28 [Erysipelotrichaceae bacterium]
CTGDVYMNAEDVDLDPYKFRQRHYSLAKIPAVCIRMKDAEEIIRKAPKKAYVNLQQEEDKTDSHNVIAEIKGTEKPDEIIVFSAHYDSVSFSNGSYDNATGSACILELLGYFSEHRPKRTLRFVWCGSEEEGLLGSKAYLKRHKKDIERIILNVNVDMVGVTLGKDIAVVTANESLVSYLRYDSLMKGFPLEVRQGVYSSDSTPFADNGIPSLSFARIAPKGGAQIHSRRDVMDHLSEENYYRTCGYIESFADQMANCAVFPVEREIPDKMKEELDYYNLRKERK